MPYYFPFGQPLRRLVQEDRTPKKVFVLGVYASAQYLKKVADVPYTTLGEYVDLYGYGNAAETSINGKTIKVLPMAHPRQIGALGAHSERWYLAHKEWENSR